MTDRWDRALGSEYQTQKERLIKLYRRKRFGALLLAVGVLLALSVPALAEAPAGSITIQLPDSIGMTGETLEAYRVLDAALGTELPCGVPEEMARFYAERYHITAGAQGFEAAVFARMQGEADRSALTRDLLAGARTAKLMPAAANVEDQVARFGSLPLGWYVVAAENASLPPVLVKLSGQEPHQVVMEKAEAPTLEKGIDAGEGAGRRSLSAFSTSAIGDRVPYVLTSRVPDLTGYSHYFFVVRDRLGKGLSYNEDLKIHLGGKRLSERYDYQTVVEPQADGSTLLKIVFLDFCSKWSGDPGAEITMRYSAAVTKEAPIGILGCENSATLTYSCDPAAQPKGEDDPLSGDVVGVTADRVTHNYVTGLQVLKADRMGKRLGGAKFRLEGEGLNTVLIRQNHYLREDEEGTYWKLNNGSYTTVPPFGATKDQYESTIHKYVRTVETKVVERSRRAEYLGETGADGVLRFDGLGAGTYTLTEIQAPAGYSKGKEPIRLQITCQDAAAGEVGCTWAVRGNAEVKQGVIQLCVVNEKESFLPETGGCGTGGLYFLGGVLVASAAMLLCRRTEA